MRLVGLVVDGVDLVGLVDGVDGKKESLRDDCSIDPSTALRMTLLRSG